MSEENIKVITDKKTLYDKCENMEQLYDKYYLPLLCRHYDKTYLLQSQLQEKEKIIEDANKILEEILVIKDGDKYRPVKNTTSQEVYKTIIKLNELLKTPHRLNYSILERK